jgi:DNA-binding NarL/FixJ family response regulator
MDEAERLSTLIGGVYDATLDPSLWPGVLRKSAQFVHGHSASLFAKDVADKTAELYYVVLLAIVEVGGVPEVADALGVAESTINSHVKRLYRKTGVNRRADLIKLVASYSSPLAS